MRLGIKDSLQGLDHGTIRTENTLGQKAYRLRRTIQ